MWHEARKQERKIRGMLVDYRRRAERRRDFYEKIKADPTQFMQLHGRSYKIHLDPNVAAAAESSSTMMPWQGQADNMIDRFDARAHLDHIPTYVSSNDPPEKSQEERQCNYERYRVLVQNSFLGLSEEKFLRQLHLEEQYGYTADIESNRKKKHGAAIGFNYDDAEGSHPLPTYKDPHKEESEESDLDLDFDLAIDISKIEMSQAHELNKYGQNFGMSGNDFYSFLTNDMQEAENLRAAREEEEERALYSGRRSRRARRAHQEKRLHNRIISPPSYAAKEPEKVDRRSRSTSKSVSPVNAGEITYITSFGGEDDTPTVPSRPSYADKVKAGPSKRKSPPSRYRSRRRRRKSSSSSSSSSSSRSSSRSNKSIRKSESPKPEVVENKPIPRYYGRRKSDKSSSELEDLSDDDSESVKDSPIQTSKVTGLVNSKSGAASKQPSSNLQDRLKRKMQILLNKQYKADKKAQQLRNEKLEQEARERDDQMRELALKLRRRQRELKNYDDSSSSGSGSEKEIKEERIKSPSPKLRSRRSSERRDSPRRDSPRRSNSRRNSPRRNSPRRDSPRRYRSRSRDRYRNDRDYHRRRYSDEERRDRRSRRDRSRSNDSRDQRRYKYERSNRKPLVDY